MRQHAGRGREIALMKVIGTKPPPIGSVNFTDHPFSIGYTVGTRQGEMVSTPLTMEPNTGTRTTFALENRNLTLAGVNIPHSGARWSIQTGVVT